jgi:diadenosine tetraphosphate (Ap4A) HIT family hydrolase
VIPARVDPDCPFCHLEERVVLENELAVAVRDLYPLAEGHTLIVPRDHEWDFFALEPAYQEAMLALAREAAAELKERGISDYTIGVNNGPAAGATVPHCHLHLIPRHPGDSPDPTGGIRWVLPERAAYWEFDLDKHQS